MGKGIYTYYKERLIEIGGNNKCLYLKNIARKSSYDIGRIFEARDAKVSELAEFLRSSKKFPLTVINNSEKKEILQNLDIPAPAASQKAPDILSVEEAEKLQKKAEKEKR